MPRIDKGGALRLQGVGRRLQDLVEHVRREPAAGGRRSLGGGAVLRRARVVPRGGGAGADGRFITFCGPHINDYKCTCHMSGMDITPKSDQNDIFSKARNADRGKPPGPLSFMNLI